MKIFQGENSYRYQLRSSMEINQIEVGICNVKITAFYLVPTKVYTVRITKNQF